MIGIIVLAVALSMDAFAVSIGLGSKNNKNIRSLALMCGIYFGIFQGIMPLIGYAAGKGVLVWIEFYAPWIAFLLLVIVGGKMVYESLSSEVEENIAVITHRVMLILAIATSIDAIAAGFTLTVVGVNPFITCIIIGITTFCFSWAGVYVGKKSGTWLEAKAEFIGGITLILIGLKTVIV